MTKSERNNGKPKENGGSNGQPRSVPKEPENHQPGAPAAGSNGSEPKEKRVDWEKVHRQLLNSSARLAWMEDMPDDTLQKAWASRAAQVAKVIEEQDQGEQIEMAIVRIGCELYGLNVQHIFDIRPFDHITRVPRVPDWVAGVVNLRGRIMSVLDLKGFLGLPKPESMAGGEHAQPHLVVVETPEMELALLVDAVLSIETLPVTQIQEATSAIRGIKPEYVQGIWVYSENAPLQKSEMDNGNSSSQEDSATSLVVVLDLPRLLADKRLVIHEEIL